MGIESLQQLLKERIGLDAASIGVSAIERAARLRQATTGVAGADDYIELVQSSSDELAEFIDAVVVGETWFFRDAGAFAALAELARRQCAKRGAGTTVRLLSLPCSTGEEPYTMAMALLDAGLPPQQFHVDAVDVSERLLARARNGTYGRSSFRGADLEFRERHFDAVPGGHRIRDGVRQQVTFRQGNLIALDPAAAERYDFVFCRNVLIYFDAATQDVALRNVASLLKPEAYLFVGAAETGLLWERDFRSTRAGAAFVFQKGKQLRAVAPLPAPRVAPARVVPPRAAAAPPRSKPSTAPSPALPAVRPGYLEEARLRADEGHFVEAARLCEQHMRENGPEAEAYYLLGLVRDASGNAADAAVHYRKALYLDPHHGEALLHLALLLDLEGQASAAQALRDRARRTAVSRNA